MQTFTDPRQFLAVAQTALEADEPQNSLILGNTQRLVQSGVSPEKPPYYALQLDGAQLQLAAMMTPPFGLVLAAGDPATADLAPLLADLRARGLHPPDVIGPNPLGQRFAELWHGQTGLQTEMPQRAYQLRTVNPATLTVAPGNLRMGQPADIPRLGDWTIAFDTEAFGHPTRPPEDLRALAEKRHADIAIWEDGGQPVSMAMRSRPTRRGCTVNLVYTPPELRRKGYATALVAQLSQTLLDEGFEFCTLFTDMNNPTSNAIYIKIGYTPICDFDKYRLVE